MAEFKKVAKEMQRMCKTHNCDNCPLGEHNISPASSCTSWMLSEPEEVERIIMKWAAEHPNMTNRMKFEEVFGCGIVTHEIHEAIPVHAVILNTSDREFEAWLNAEYKGGQE